MNKKVLILLFFIFLLCGCTAEVNINIGESITEEINITYYANDMISKDNILNNFRDFVPVYKDTIVLDAEPDEKKDGVIYYSKKVTDLGNGYKFTYSYDYLYNNYHKSRSFSEGFVSPYIGQNPTSKNDVISTGNNGSLYISNYPDLTELKINIITDYEVVSTNGVKNGNTYTWTFNQYDNNRSIYFEFKKSDGKVEIIDKEVVVDQTSKKKVSLFSKLVNEHPFMFGIVGVCVILLTIKVIFKINGNKYR